ncbi:MAG: class I SAM-dependent methyltransferase [Deltaproteobacteria bacterium]|nr:MAG: class I SAM-dependent methyltransferase [Deltaproteobacteria bacterium]
MLAIECLKNRGDIERSKKVLRRRGFLHRGDRLLRIVRSSRFFGKIHVGDPMKSWDLLKTVTFLESHVPKEAPVLDIGAYASAVLPTLRKMGFQNLAGIDLNEDVKKMPFPESIRYETGDFMKTPFPAGTFAAITAVSVIEHGFSGTELLSEVRRLLSPGGYFVASVDYWPEKIDTRGIRAFGLDWTIFSEAELVGFVHEAGKYGLYLPWAADLRAEERVAHWFGKDYTFAWLVLQNKNDLPG